MELVVELAALLALVAAVWTNIRRNGAPEKLDWPLAIMLLIMPLVALIQLVPLPPAIWQSLPNRGIESAALALVGAAHNWMPISVSPARTLSALLSFIPPLVVAILVARLPIRGRTYLLLVLGVLGVISAAVGTVQLASGSADLLRFYHYTHERYATGFQASRNAQGDILVLCAMAVITAAVILRRAGNRALTTPIVGAGLAVMLISLLLTGSRAGIALSGVAVVLAVLLIAPRMRLLGARALGILLVGALALGTVGFVTAHDNSRLQRTFGRFSMDDGSRGKIWEDSVYAIHQTWPVGTGIGSFQTTFPAAERLEYVRDTFANRAHNDYLELIMETGIAGVLFLIAAIVFLAVRVFELLRRQRDPEIVAQVMFVCAAAAVILLHSVVDYPLRSMSTACIAGLCAGLLARARSGVRRADADRIGGD